MMHLAEINIARLKHDLDDPRVAPFADNIARVNGIAERSDGFIWRNVAETSGPIQGNARMIATVSVWWSVAQFERFVWDTLHRQFYQKRAEWFDILDRMHFAMWWVAPDTQPSLGDAFARLDHLNTHGNSDHAFGWDHLPDATRWRDTQAALQIVS
ncbi:DUF3291 domain-containing protein [Hasllibacter sp. MH4015]|uniref:DUF3291 domain-containing protein n=1 Tax=Hasllibacter sp. MH4015 TaxID=2854029 RepID=UPI001CD7C85E|nr:DUF3291 domain-containing protein [Hasllibacter sp. MH4015]